MYHFVCEAVFSGAFEESMRWLAWACDVMEAGYCLLVHCRLPIVQRILQRSWCGYVQAEADMRVKNCIGFGSCSVVH